MYTPNIHIVLSVFQLYFYYGGGISKTSGDCWTRELVQAYREILGGILENELDSIFCKWASLIAQLVKNLPTVRQTWVQSLGWKDPLEKGKAAHSSILA